KSKSYPIWNLDRLAHFLFWKSPTGTIVIIHFTKFSGTDFIVRRKEDPMIGQKEGRMRMVASVVNFLLRHRSGYRDGGVHVLKTVIVMCCFVLTGCASAQILHYKQQARLYADLQ